MTELMTVKKLIYIRDTLRPPLLRLKGGLDVVETALNTHLTLSANALPALNFTTFFAGILMVLPV